MNSYISNFKAAFAALMAVLAIEATYSVVSTTSPAERSGYLDLNFNTMELFQKALIYSKLEAAVAAKPQVVQIGDSSGLHAVIPRIVDQYLDGLKYENMSCCAITGSDGYYSIAEFMFRNVPSIKAVVLYTSWHNGPAELASHSAEIGPSEVRLRYAVGWPSHVVMPATLAARPDVLRAVYAPTAELAQPGLEPVDKVSAFASLVRFLRKNAGWWPEHDTRVNSTKHDEWLAKLCTDVMSARDLEEAYSRDIFNRPQPYAQTELRRLANLAARYGAKLIVVFQPFTCPAISEGYLAKRLADLVAVAAEYPNIVIGQPAFEPWSGKRFISMDHLGAGNEDEASRRVGRMVATALGLPVREPPPLSPAKLPALAWSSTDFSAPSWVATGAVVHAPQTLGAGYTVTETTEAGWHRLSSTKIGVAPKTYLFSIRFRIEGHRQLRFELMDASLGTYGYVRCDPLTLEAAHSVEVLDSGIETTSDGAFRCWGRMELAKPDAFMSVTLVQDTRNLGPYKGDGNASIVLYRTDLSVDDPG